MIARSLGKMAAVAAVALVASLGAAPADSAPVSYSLTTEFSGASAPAGSGPWGTALFTDVGVGTVRLTLTGALSGGEFYSAWYFSLNPAFDPTGLSFTLVPGATAPSPVIELGTDAFKADGDGKYDILLDFPPPGKGRFDGTETISWDITCGTCAGFDAEDFFALSLPDGGHGPFYLAAHVQGIAGGLSGWLTGGRGGAGGGGGAGGAGGGTQVPEPATLVLLGTGLLGLGVGFGVKRRVGRR